MAFDFNWAPQKLPLQMINGRARAAADNMAGYVPNEGNPGILGNEILAENAVDNMKGYNPNLQEQRYVGRTPQQFNNAGQGQGYTFNDPEYTQYMQAQAQADQEAAAKEQQIADIESQISALEKRITENKTKLQKWTGNADQIAAIEARKINRQDPTSIWRWKVDREEARRIANAQNKPNDVAKANALIDANNTLDSMIIDDSLDTPTKNAMLSKLADVKSSLEKNGFDTTRVNSMISKLKENGGQTPREQAQTTWHGLQGKKDLTSAELDAAINDPNMKWDPNDLEDAKNLRDKLKKHEAATQSVKNMKADYKRRTGKDFDKADPYIQKKEQERWKRRNKK